ncbi:MAG: hypothetical protein GF405_09635 [Candidatus Eisenbacteria bacterium]|nr:hypothetical protein [Candidatus Eisenbacteria bacterium]
MAYATYRALSSMLWFAAGPWLAWRRASGGTEWRERLGELPRSTDRPVWVHAASVGEVAAAEPVVRELVSRGREVLLTTMTPTGQRAAEQRLGDIARTAFVPLDAVPAVRRALGRVRPRSLVLVESELWPNLMAEAEDAGVPVGLVNARLSGRALARARAPLSPVRDAVLRLTAVACRDTVNAERFRVVGVPDGRISVTGDTKFDTLPGLLSDGERTALRKSLGSEGGRPCVVFGSVRPREESAIADVVSSLSGDARVLVAPRHMRRVAPIQRRLEGVGVKVVRRSSGAVPDGDGVVLVDTTGELARLYAAGDVAFVGGTLGGYGGHNPLEPAARGVPVVFGPDTRSCASAARALVEGGGAVEVSGRDELREEIERILADDRLRSGMSSAALAVVKKGRGAARRSVDALADAGLLEER